MLDIIEQLVANIKFRKADDQREEIQHVQESEDDVVLVASGNSGPL